jgi:hypothetical protein
VAASAISFASAGVAASGFSHQTVLPAASAASAIGLCKELGVVIDTISTAGSITRLRQSSLDRAKPSDPAARSANGASMSAMISKRGSSGNAKLRGAFRIA